MFRLVSSLNLSSWPRLRNSRIQWAAYAITDAIIGVRGSSFTYFDSNPRGLIFGVNPVVRRR